MLCPNCKTRNPIGFKFCHECGAPMAAPVGELAVEEALQAETERRHQHAAALLAGALELREQRQYPEAIPLAEEASEIMPDSASAFTLLASLYERTGDHERAILAMERVVAINPESVEDKVRLERMKDGIVLPEEPRRNPIWSQLLPVGAAAGVAATIFAIGYPILNGSFNTKAAAKTTIIETTGQTQETIGAPEIPVPTPGAMSSPTYAPLPTESRPDPFTPLVQKAYSDPSPTADTAAPRLPSTKTERSQVRERERESAPRDAGSRDTSNNPTINRRVPPATIPAQNNGGDNKNSDSSDLTGNGLPGLGSVGNSVNGSNSTGDASSNFGAGGRLRVGPPTGNSTAGNAGSGNDTPASSQNSGDSYIRIQVKPPSEQTRVTAPSQRSDDSDTRPGESAMARGRRLYRSGKYREAIAAYREAGGAEAQQGIATSQRALGDNEGARGAYREAARLYEAQGNSAGAQTCRAALEALGG